MATKGAVTVARSPRALKTPSRRRGARRKSGSESGKTSIAIVENELNLISIYSYVVKNLGFNPIFIAREGEEIVRAIADGRASPDVIIMDYRLPGMNGIETAKRILERRPATKVIVASADDSVRDESISLGFSFLQKPFSLETFAERIRRVVSQIPGSPESTDASGRSPQRKRSSSRA
ncbi:MAG: response regulator transcription factor [Nitrososphaerales archaeon]|jgi:two-component system chemotaxis response regulator CheY